MSTERFKPTEQGDKVRVSPTNVVGSLLVLQVLEIKEAFKTRFAPEGKPAVRLNITSVDTGKSAQDQIWSNGAIVDGLRPYVNTTVTAKLEYRVSGATGYRYLNLVPVSDEEQKRADDYVEKHPEVFTAQSPVTDEPSPEIADTSIGHW